jgi:alkaline phosphatase D
VPLGASGGAVLLGAPAAQADPLARVDDVPARGTRTWLGPQYWANRLADWRLASGRLECLSGGRGGRTVGVLTRSLRAGAQPASLSVRTGTLAAGTGFSGFVVGTGAGALDWRAAALVMGPSGRGGGFLAVYDSDGVVRFREHTDEESQFAFAVLPSGARTGPAPARTLGEDVTLQLDIVPDGAGRFDLTLSASDARTSALLSRATRTAVPDGELLGGLSLISGTTAGGTARHWLRELRTAGAKVAGHGRQVGPVLGTLYSLSGSTLKLTAQLMPIGTADPQHASLQVRPPGTQTWRAVQSVAIGVGYTALFRVPGWDASRDWDYRVGYAAGTAQEHYYTGVVRRDPRTTPV